MTRLALIALLALAGCAGSPPPPDWKLNTRSGLDAFEKHYLDGNGKLAELNFAKARAETARTGRPDLVARLELARCAIRAAALEFGPCAGYEALQDEAGAAEKAYAAFLAGAWQGLDTQALPKQYAALLSAGSDAKLAGIEDPVSRLIAAGVLFRAGRIGPAGLATAVETASGQGWRRPLLAWLGVELKRAEAAADTVAAGKIRKRLELVVSGLPAAGDKQ